MKYTLGDILRRNDVLYDVEWDIPSIIVTRVTDTHYTLNEDTTHTIETLDKAHWIYVHGKSFKTILKSL